MKQTLLRVPGVRPVADVILPRRDRRRMLRQLERQRLEFERRDRETLAALVGRADLRLNVGSSGHALDGWVNIDIRQDETCFGMDATKPWPFEPGSAAAVNSEHFIEHLTAAEAKAYLAEAQRVLRPGGVIRTTTPNLRGIVETYLEAGSNALSIHRSHGYQAATHAEMVNNYFYCWDHRQIYDFASLARLLHEAGFAEVVEARFGESDHEATRGIERHDAKGLEQIILCVDAVKPG